MHSPSSILPYFYAAIVKAGSLIKTKETHSMPEKREREKRNIPGILLCADFLSGLGLKNVRDYSRKFAFCFRTND
jgi:hypothetical protein